MKMSEGFNRAAELVRGGWFQVDHDGETVRTTGGKCYCTLTAMEAVKRDFPQLSSEMNEFFRRRLGTPNIARWNDDPLRTQQEVVAALELCAIEAARGGD